MVCFEKKTQEKKRSESIMDVTKMLTELRQERESIEEAIMVLERLARGRGRRRGRPPAWLMEARKRATGRTPGRSKATAAKSSGND
jgi:hypothetical protein